MIICALNYIFPVLVHFSSIKLGLIIFSCLHKPAKKLNLKLDMQSLSIIFECPKENYFQIYIYISNLFPYLTACLLSMIPYANKHILMKLVIGTPLTSRNIWYYLLWGRFPFSQRYTEYFSLRLTRKFYFVQKVELCLKNYTEMIHSAYRLLSSWANFEETWQMNSFNLKECFKCCRKGHEGSREACLQHFCLELI